MASGGEFPGGKEGISPKYRGLMAQGQQLYDGITITGSEG